MADLDFNSTRLVIGTTLITSQTTAEGVETSTGSLGFLNTSYARTNASENVRLHNTSLGGFAFARYLNERQDLYHYFTTDSTSTLTTGSNSIVTTLEAFSVQMDFSYNHGGTSIVNQNNNIQFWPSIFCKGNPSYLPTAFNGAPISTVVAAGSTWDALVNNPPTYCFGIIDNNDPTTSAGTVFHFDRKIFKSKPVNQLFPSEAAYAGDVGFIAGKWYSIKIEVIPIRLKADTAASSFNGNLDLNIYGGFLIGDRVKCYLGNPYVADNDPSRWVKVLDIVYNGTTQGLTGASIDDKNFATTTSFHYRKGGVGYCTGATHTNDRPAPPNIGGTTGIYDPAPTGDAKFGTLTFTAARTLVVDNFGIQIINPLIP